MKAYEAYRESGVEWVGQIPTHWRLVSLKYLVSMQSGDAITSEQIEEVGEFPVFGGNGLRGYTATYTHQGDFVLIGRQGALCGNINYARGQFWASEHAVVVSPKFPCAIIWLGELLRCMNLGQYSVSAAQPGLSVEALGNLRIPVPPPGEQSAIAAFLDQETGKIDALVAEQERLIALLKEKRQAVISQAVTKGLNPNAPMKDSGIEWLGQVPAHWEVGHIKRFCRDITDGAHISPETEGGVYDFVSTKDITDDGIDFDGSLKTSPATYEYMARTGCRPEDGDVLFSKDGTIGRTALVSGHREFVVASSLIILRPNTELALPAYLYWFLQSHAIIGQVECFVKGAGLPRLSIQNLLKVWGVFPPVSEQAAIANKLLDLVGAFRDLIAISNQKISLLRERRAALISAAVTGKIDVRSIAPTKQEAA